MKHRLLWSGLGLAALLLAVVVLQRFRAVAVPADMPSDYPSSFTPEAPLMMERVVPETNANQALWDAVKRNDVAQVRAAFAAGGDANAAMVTEPQEWPRRHDASPPTPLLFIAARHDETPAEKTKAVAIFHEFLARGVNVTKPDSKGMAAVHWAVLLQDVALVRAVLDKGGDPNATYTLSDDGGNALYTASLTVLRGHAADAVPLYELLLSRGADPNVSLGGLTPLQRAALLGQAPVVAVLLKHGADVSREAGTSGFRRSRGSFTALLLAQRSGDPETIRLLRQAAQGQAGHRGRKG